jgi:hypothetical protein
MEMLYEACKAFMETYICIGALDECEEKENLLDYFIEVHSAVNSICLICTGHLEIHSMVKKHAHRLNPYMTSIEACESEI